MSIAIKTEQLSKTYGTKTALSDCSISLPKQHIIGLVGPNGAGKTTLINLIMGLLMPDSGKLQVLGLDPIKESSKLLPRIGFVSQERALYRDLTVSEMLKFGKKLNPGFDSPYALSYLERLDIPLKTRVKNLSGGMKAHLAIILALAKRPELLVMDEPFANLDPLARHQLLQLIAESTVGEGNSVLISTHDISELEKVCDTLVLINRSRVLLCGDIESLLATHKWITLTPEDANKAAETLSILSVEKAQRAHRLLVRINGITEFFHMPEPVESTNLEELILAYLALNHQEVESLNSKFTHQELIS